MKKRILQVLLCVSLGLAAGVAPTLRAQSPAPLIAAPVAPSARTVEDKQADAAKRIAAQLAQLQSSLKFAVSTIQREVERNRDGLTPDQVRAGLGAEKAASLAAASAELIAFANKYAPGTFPIAP